MSASCVLPPKSTMLEMVEATEELMWVMTSTPRKLNPALSRMAGRTRMQRVLMQVAMALGASVQPLTKMTPSVSTTVMSSTGLAAICPRKCDNDTSMGRSPYIGIPRYRQPRARRAAAIIIPETRPCFNEFFTKP